MSLRFKLNQLAHIAKQTCVAFPRRARCSYLSFLSSCSLPRRKCHLMGRVCWQSLSVHPRWPSWPGPCCCTLIPLGLGCWESQPGWLLWLYLSLTKVSQYHFPPFLLIYVVVFCPLIIVFCLFQIRTFASVASSPFRNHQSAHKYFMVMRYCMRRAICNCS